MSEPRILRSLLQLYSLVPLIHTFHPASAATVVSSLASISQGFKPLQTNVLAFSECWRLRGHICVAKVNVIALDMNLLASHSYIQSNPLLSQVVGSIHLPPRYPSDPASNSDHLLHHTKQNIYSLTQRVKCCSV